MKPPSNDVCRAIIGGYSDVMWNYKGRWRAMVLDYHIGYYPTKRRAKKAVARYSTKGK